MARGPELQPKHADLLAGGEETLSLDQSRWSGFRDGLGERENGVDEQGFSIELLRLRKELGSFALPLTDRILRLIDFDRPGVTRALRVDQDEHSPRLVLVSERAAGFRLAELLERGAERGVIPDLGAALFVMRRLLATAAAIRRDCGIAHVAIAPERIVITPRGNVVIVEAALAGAFEAFGDELPAAVRKATRLARANHDADGAHLDIARIALAGMAMIVGRPLPPDDDIDPLSPVVQEVVDVAALRAGDGFAAALTPWLDRAISVDPHLAFPDFAEALEALVETVPPKEARCAVSRGAVRKFLDDLSLDGSVLEQLAALEEDRTREIRARVARRAPAVAAAVAAAAGGEIASAEEDPIAAIMDMPLAVEDLSSEIIKQPVAVDDQPSAIAAVIQVAITDRVDDAAAAAFDLIDHSGEPAADAGAEPDTSAVNSATIAAQVEVESLEERYPAPETGEAAAAGDCDSPVAEDGLVRDASHEPSSFETPAGETPADEAAPYDAPGSDTPEYDPAAYDTSAYDTPAHEAPAYAIQSNEMPADAIATYEPLPDEIPAYQEPYLDSTLDDLVEEILRRGDEPDLIEASPADAIVTDQTVTDPAASSAAADTMIGESPEHDDPSIYPYESPERPVDEPPAEHPPVDDPGPEDPPTEEPPPSEPPAEEPPGETPPIGDPPPVTSIWRDAARVDNGDGAPGYEEQSGMPAVDPEAVAEEPPPLWLRAAIEQVARSRGDRPVNAPPPSRSEPLGPVFELHDEPERELQPETTTLSDIAKELGLTIEPEPDAPKAPWDAPPVEEASAAAVPEPADEDESEWDEDVRIALLGHRSAPADVVPATGAAAPPLEDPPYYQPLPSRAPLPTFESTPAPTMFIPPPAVEHEPAPHADEPARPSIADRLPEIRESGGRFLKIAAMIAVVVGVVGGAIYGGRSYYASMTAPGTLVVESTPAGAQVLIDGEAKGATPLSLELPPGSHTIEMKRRDVTRRFTVDVRPGEQTTQTLDWATVRVAGSLAVTTDPPGAKVSVDGRAYGVTPLTIPELPVGRRRVVLEGASGTLRREVTVEAAQTATLNEAIFSGFLAVFAPVELQIFSGSKLLGTTDNSRIMIPAGRHELTLVNKEIGARLTRTVDVEPGQVAAVNITEVPAAPAPQ